MVKKKILYLSQMYPYPADGGGKIKTLNTLRTLAKEYNVFAVFISEKTINKNRLGELEKLNIRIKVFYSNKILSSVKDNLIDLSLHFLRGIPHYVFQYTCKPAFPFIRKLINDFDPDIIHVDHLNMAQYLPREKKQVWILEHHNVEFYLYWTRFLSTTKPTRKLYLFIEMVLTYLFENKTLKKFDHVFAISPIETERVRRFFRVNNVSTQTVVYPVTALKHAKSTRTQLLFVGNLSWPPNEDAVGWFMKEIFPLVLKKIPDAEFHVVGKRQPRYEKNWPKAANIFLHGYQQDITPFLAKALVFVMPFRMGGGMRVKAFTALSAGIPIVSTPLGIEGLGLTHGQNYLQAKDAKTFASAVYVLLKNKKQRDRFAGAGLTYLKRHHSADRNLDFLSDYLEIINNFSR